MGKVSYTGIFIIILLTSISASGAVSIENIVKPNISEANPWDPVLSPDGTKIAYVAYDNARNQQIFTMNIDGTEAKKISNNTNRKWGLSWGKNKIAYVSFGNDGLEKIFTINPDGTENKQLIFDNTRQGNSAEDKPPTWAAPSWSPDGNSLAYTSLDEKADSKLYTVNSDGTGKKLVYNDEFKQWSPSISPDGKDIVYVSYTANYEIELFRIGMDGKNRKQLTFDGIKKNYPYWGPGGVITFVSYESVTSSGEKIFAVNDDGTNRRLFVDSDFKQRTPAFSQDGTRFIYAAIDISGKVKIAVGKVAGVAASVIQTMTPIITPIQTVAITTPAPEETSPIEETPVIMKNDIWTMILVLFIIVIVLVGVLLISDIFTKK